MGALAPAARSWASFTPDSPAGSVPAAAFSAADTPAGIGAGRQGGAAPGSGASASHVRTITRDRDAGTWSAHRLHLLEVGRLVAAVGIRAARTGLPPFHAGPPPPLS